VRNGLLLRADLHRLFDKGYVTVTSALQLDIGSRLKQDFRNGRSYYPLHGKQLHVPPDAKLRPAQEFLRWHNDSRFRG
jgi:putative restriction endonuclease